ncbi:YncE family protein [Alkalicoccus chagannorensis]|uniref:YncE family protein n=1 Tax=Alkalicoccus chagannorensis TaxID=427072 RepID=UPI000426BA1B|nr:YncE family protein [Alkalicoccus chagannorensis]
MRGRLIVLNKDEDTLSVIDAETGRTETKVETSHNPHEIVVTRDQKKAYIACSLGNTLDILDTTDWTIEKSLTHPSFSFPHGLALSPDQRTLYLASTYNSHLFRINTEDDTIIDVQPTFQRLSHMVSLSPDGSRAYIPNIGSDNITVFDTENLSFVTHIPVGAEPEGIAVHPLHPHLYASNQKDGTLHVIDTNTWETLFKRRIGSVPVRLVFSPDQRHVLTANRESHDVSVIDTDFILQGESSPREIKRIPTGRWAGGIVFDDAGAYAFVANNKTNDVSVIDTVSWKETARLDAGIHPDGIAWLP